MKFNPMVEIQDGLNWIKIPFKNLRKGDVFRNAENEKLHVVKSDARVVDVGVLEVETED